MINKKLYKIYYHRNGWHINFMRNIESQEEAYRIVKEFGGNYNGRKLRVCKQ